MTLEKEINVYLMTMREILEDLLEVATKENAQETMRCIEKELKRVNEKIYQNPPLSN